MDLKFFENLHSLEIKLAKLEKQLKHASNKYEHDLSLLRRQFVLSKQGAPILDWAILNAYPYIDLSPQQAYEQYMNPNVIYKVLDVSADDFQTEVQFDNYMKISIDKLEEQLEEIKNSKGLLLIISEDGLNSILACEKLASLGVFHCFNVSGGYEYWPESERVKRSA